MGSQKGALKLKGSHGDFTFAETAAGFIWGKKRKSIPIEAILTNPDLVKIKHNIQEFGRAGKAVKLVRKAFHAPLEFAKDRRLTPRMQKLMVKVVKSDITNDRGDRVSAKGDFQILQNFEMNVNALLFRSMGVDFNTAYDRVTGNITIDIPAFVPAQLLKHAPNATHYKIIAAAAEFDFDNDKFESSAFSSANLPIDTVTTAPLAMTMSLSPASAFPVLIVVGIQYSEKVNGRFWPERQGEFNALTIVKTDNP